MKQLWLVLLVVGCGDPLEVRVPEVHQVPVAKPPVVPPKLDGRWSMSLAMHFSYLPTMETEISDSTTGAAWLNLAPDGTLSACFGSKRHGSYSRSKYASADHKPEHNEHDEVSLVGMTGTWVADVDGRATLTLTAASWSTCSVGQSSFDPQTVLHCAVGSPGPSVPAGVLRCDETTDAITRVGIRLEPPVTKDDERHAPTGTAMLFGRDPGLVVTLEQHRSTDVTLRAVEGDVALSEQMYQQPKKKAP